jgi:AraC family transcriptional regulator
MSEQDNHSVFIGLPNWGAKGGDLSTPLGKIRYFFDQPHDDKFIVDVNMVVVNMNYDETDIAINSDQLGKLITPRDCAVLVPAGSDVREISDGTTEALIFEIPQIQVGKLLEECGHKDVQSLRYRDDLIDTQVGDYARLMRTAFISQSIEDNLYFESLLVSAQQQIIATYCNTELDANICSGKLTKRALERVREFIEANLYENITLDNMAVEAALSPYHFNRAFKATTGHTPYQAVLERRLIHARRYLSDSKYSICEIAFMTGFSSQSHLTESFRRFLGVTPGQFRQYALV